MNTELTTKKLTTKELLLLATFKAKLDALFTYNVYLHRDCIDDAYDEFTSTTSSKDAYSNPNQLDMFDENIHVKDV